MILKKVTTTDPSYERCRIEFLPRKTVWYLFGIPVFTAIVRLKADGTDKSAASVDDLRKSMPKIP
ncbi:MAG: hypothetical protein LBV41_03040 [Cytophagaceae bacterium]|jgi:hypothetical protein|nr:hypothetical protein [Cytophagaceae bacterium]